MLVGDFWTTPKVEGWLPGEPTMWSEGWNFQSHLHTHPLANHLIKGVYVMKPP